MVVYSLLATYYPPCPILQLPIPNFQPLMTNLINKRLEQYTVKRPQEVLLVTVEVDGERDEVAIFRGFSSSLMRPTAFDPDVSSNTSTGKYY